MCFGGGGGKSASEMYKEQKIDYGALPSLSQKKVERKTPAMKDIELEQREGTKRRSLLNPYGVEY